MAVDEHYEGTALYQNTGRLQPVLLSSEPLVEERQRRILSGETTRLYVGDVLDFVDCARVQLKESA